MTINSTPAERSLQASLAAHALHAKHDSRVLTTKAREAAFGRFVDMVDPDRTLPEDERIRRANHAQQAHMKSMALRSAQSRRRNKAARATAALTTSPPEFGEVLDGGVVSGGIDASSEAETPATTSGEETSTVPGPTHRRRVPSTQSTESEAARLPQSQAAS